MVGQLEVAGFLFRRRLPTEVLYGHSRQIQTKQTMQIYGSNLHDYPFGIFESCNFRTTYRRCLSVDSRVSSYDIRGVPQVGRGANQVNCRDPYSSDFRAANT